MTDRAPVVWRTVSILGFREETPTARTLVLDVEGGWPGHRPGQHVDVRLTAADGYQAQRSYSIASAPERPNLELSVEVLPTGEVSPWLARIAEPGDRFEVRGPIGRPFSWTVQDGGPLLLVAGGSGLVPLIAMLRHRAARGSDVPARLLVSARRAEDLFYADELYEFGAEATLTREVPPGWQGFTGRVTAAMLDADGFRPADRPRCFVCGPTPFVEHVTTLLVDAGHDPARVAAERFGPTA